MISKYKCTRFNSIIVYILAGSVVHVGLDNEYLRVYWVQVAGRNLTLSFAVKILVNIILIYHYYASKIVTRLAAYNNHNE